MVAVGISSQTIVPTEVFILVLLLLSFGSIIMLAIISASYVNSKRRANRAVQGQCSSQELLNWKKLYDDGVVTVELFEQKKNEILTRS